MTSNADFDLASMREQQEREAAVEAARAVLKTSGTTICIGCDEEIPEPRRRAAPFAVRCVKCQRIHEQENQYR